MREKIKSNEKMTVDIDRNIVETSKIGIEAKFFFPCRFVLFLFQLKRGVVFVVVDVDDDEKNSFKIHKIWR